MRSIPNGWRVAALVVIAWFAVTMAACTDAVPQANRFSPQSARAVPVTVDDQPSHTQPADQPQQSETNSGPQEDSADQQPPENARRDGEESAPAEGVAVIGGQCGGIPTDLHGLFDWEWQRAVPGPTVAEIEAMDLERFPPRPGGRSDRAVDLKVNFQTACVQLDDGTVQCWGWNPWDQFPPAGRFVQTDWECGVRPDGSFECWGDASGDRDRNLNQGRLRKLPRPTYIFAACCRMVPRNAVASATTVKLNRALVPSRKSMQVPARPVASA